VATLSTRSLLARAPREFLYVSLSAPLGLIWLIVLAVLVSLGFGLIVLVIGLPLLRFTLAVTHWGANTERSRAALVLGTPIPRPPRMKRSGGLWRRTRMLMRDRTAWKEAAYMGLLAPVGMVAGGVVIVLWSGVVAAVASPVFRSFAPTQSLLGKLTPAELAAVVFVGLIAGAITILITRGFAVGMAAMAEGLLAPDDRAVLEARVDTLEATRAAAVESADTRLRRLERDLHDGAQHRLAYIAMELDRARSKLADDPGSASELLDRAHEESKRAMGELRDLVRGIHPSVLTDRGLDAAVSGLAERCPVPVDVEVQLDRRPPNAVETAAYYVVAEALTNVGKHAGASAAAVDIFADDTRLVIEVRDDGHGGATRAPGSGLEGLAQRVEALDGSLTIDSPEDGPTAVRAELPCAS
jgi:signal transduction histidine kinase